jgi:hypothetical protein
MQRRIYINTRSLGWPERILAGAIGILLLLLGFVFGAVILSLAAIAGLAFAARVWWLRRRLLRQQPQNPADKGVIDAEYRVIHPPGADRHRR